MPDGCSDWVSDEGAGGQLDPRSGRQPDGQPDLQSDFVPDARSDEQPDEQPDLVPDAEPDAGLLPPSVPCLSRTCFPCDSSASLCRTRSGARARMLEAGAGDSLYLPTLLCVGSSF